MKKPTIKILPDVIESPLGFMGRITIYENDRLLLRENTGIERSTSRDAMIDAEWSCKELRDKSIIELGSFARVIR